MSTHLSNAQKLTRARETPGSTPTAREDAGDDAGNRLISRVRAKRAKVERYLRVVGARRRRLVNVTIVAGAIATMLTAAPALGGKPLAGWLTETFELSSPSWRILCALAAVCSLIAAVATQLHTSKNYEEHIARAQEIKATLEMLEVAITSDHLNQHEATSEYLKIIENTSFIEAAR
jgi:MFS family permease